MTISYFVNTFTIYNAITKFSAEVLAEVLAPVVLDENMVESLKPMGLDKNNKVRWQFPGAGEKVPTVFIQVQAKQLDFSVKDYNARAKKYLRRNWKETDDLSLDKFPGDAADDETESGFDPTGNMKDMDEFELKEMLLGFRVQV